MNTIEKITIRENKILKLTNVLIRTVSENELMDIGRIGYMMESYIKSKGNTIVGPMINYSSAELGQDGQPNVIVKLLVQLKNPIHNVEAPYEQIPLLRIANCLFARFIEKEENLQFAYQKLNVYAFENDIKLKGDTYTIFVRKEEENLVADVFMECAKGGELVESL